MVTVPSLRTPYTMEQNSMQSASAKPPVRKRTQADVTETFSLHIRKHIGQRDEGIDKVQRPAMYGIPRRPNYCELHLFACFRRLSDPINGFLCRLNVFAKQAESILLPCILYSLECLAVRVHQSRSHYHTLSFDEWLNRGSRQR
jgi:hypothetical protein